MVLSFSFIVQYNRSRVGLLEIETIICLCQVTIQPGKIYQKIVGIHTAFSKGLKRKYEENFRKRLAKCSDTSNENFSRQSFRTNNVWKCRENVFLQNL